jgi:hypothetical protein
MTIRFTSSLTPEDENAVAPVVIAALSNILELLPIAYAIRIDTSDSKIYQHQRTLAAAVEPVATIRGLSRVDAP